MKYVLILCLATLATLATLSSAKPQCLGCSKTLLGEELKKLEEDLGKSLAKLAAGDGPKYKLIKINHAYEEIVNGKKDQINADLQDQDDNKKTCDIEIWLQPWLQNGSNIVFNCPGEKQVIAAFST